MSPDQFKQLADLLPDPMLLVSGDCCILAVNRGLTKALKCSSEELQSVDLTDIASDPPDRIQHTYARHQGPGSR